jgi:tripartite-type tricarboxylate transporter receptor subunit TctC
VWYGLLVPARTPQALVARLHKDVGAVLRSPEVRDPLSADTIEPSLSESPKAFLAFYAAEAAKWGALVRETGARPE